LAVNQRFEQYRYCYELQQAQLIESNKQMEQTMTTFKRVSELSKKIFRLEDITVERMVQILASVIKCQKTQDPFEVFNLLQ